MSCDDPSDPRLNQAAAAHLVIHGALYSRRHEYDAMIASLEGRPELERVAAVEPSGAAVDGASQRASGTARINDGPWMTLITRGTVHKENT